MAKLTISEASALISVSRQTLYRKLRDGTLSRDADKRVDLSELMRVFPPSEYNYVTPADDRETSQSDTADTQTDTAKDRLIEHLEAENERLRAEKAEYWETLKKERERADALLAALPDLTQERKRKSWLFFWKK